jgi:hypothetical protein
MAEIPSRFKVGKGKEAVEVRVVAFCDVETQTEYCISTSATARNPEILGK